MSSVYEELLERVGEANPRPRIEPVSRLAGLLGEPQLTFPVIHVAGTNGKTSTSRAIEILLRSHGLRTGLFTSPHLISFEERIRIDGEEVTQLSLDEAWDEMQVPLQVVDEQLEREGQSKITFFEALTVLAFVVFTDAPIDVAVIEVGMGGEWDATNIVEPSVVVFTPIELDHTEFLGSTLEEIAATKAGIIKNGVSTVTSKQHQEVLRVLREKAAENEAPLYIDGDDFAITKDTGAVGGRVFEARGITGEEYTNVLLPLFGKHQSGNALLAMTAVETYFGANRAISDEVLSDAFANLTSPGRLQIVSNAPLILVDAAHNPHGAAQLVQAIDEHFAYDELALVYGVFADKDFSGVLRQLAPLATRVFVTAVRSERTAPPEQVAEEVRALNGAAVVDEFDDSEEALFEARSWAAQKEGRVVLATGSVVLAGEAIAIAETQGWKS